MLLFLEFHGFSACSTSPPSRNKVDSLLLVANFTGAEGESGEKVGNAEMQTMWADRGLK